ncbi:SNF2 helicase associated domain-containing protein [Mesobacillus maritimus]|uniref:DEAD/DEAH box helicase n=1 Tax=Mesobacillus maritimus TaxID=1643336 RepID=UPI00384F83D7
MNVKLSHKMIKEKCGTVSFKRGDAFYRGNHVVFKEHSLTLCKAIVKGVEDFQVTIEKQEDGRLHTSCSCPKLSSFQKDCQHIAAVLISIYEQRRETSNESLPKADTKPEPEITESFLTLFDDQSKRKSVHQLHFENREVLAVQLIFKPVTEENGQSMMGISLKIGGMIVKQLRSLLLNIAEGKPEKINASFLYDPTQHCFLKEHDSILQQLIEVIQDKKVLAASEENISNEEDEILILPPSAWNQMVPLLTKAPSVHLEYDGKTVEGLQLANGPLPLDFAVEKSEKDRFHLHVKGLTSIVVLKPYHSIIADGKLFELTRDDFHRLTELTQMIDASGRNYLPLAKNQLGFFMEKVVPGLRKIGAVHIPIAFTKEFIQTPLVAKLYLDRVNNRLLAGLEFHYEKIVFNPLDEREAHAATILIRDEEKENQILSLMEESSFAQTESGYFLHNDQLEYEFLTHIVPKLQKLVQIYATTAVRNRVFRGTVAPKISVKIKKERTNWLEFKFKMDGIPENDIREILQALEEKRKYYRLRNGSLLSLETKEFQEIERFLKALPEQTEDYEREFNLPIVRGLQLLDSINESGAFDYEESFYQFLDKIHHPEQLEFEVPNRLVPILRDYQVHGYKWMKTLASYNFGGILADDMGLGKTVQAIAYIVSVLEEVRAKRLPVLVVCPTALTYNWLSEFMNFAPELQAIVIDGTQKERSELQKEMNDMDVVITSYPLLRIDLIWFEKQVFHSVFFDEAQAFKNPLTQTARAVKKIQANHRFALTGTPVENSIEELWSIFHVVFPELFQGLREYSHLSRATISRRIQPFMLRRVKEDVLSELPEKIESMESAELLPEQKQLYAAYLAKLRHDTLKHLDKDTLRKNKIRILAGLTRLRQICCHPGLFVDGYKGSSAKFEQLMQIVEESKHSGRRVLIFSQFTKMLELIGRELAIRGLPFYYLDGQTPSEERVNICNQFNAGGRDFFLISLKAGGTGLNLTGADTVILYDLWWNPAVEEQAADRAHRMGQSNTVQVIKLVARGTIEEKMNELQEKKRHMIDEIIGSQEKANSTLSEEDIREILNL